MCNETFHVSKKSTQRFCSTKCQNNWQKTITGDKNPKTNKIKMSCDHCGKKIYIIESNYKRFKNHFCSNDCRKEWYANVFSQNEQWKEQSRIRATNILSNRKIDTNTKPQIIVNNLLCDLKIQYRNEENFIYYSVDNYLTEYNLIVEVMGDYWHGSPLKYNNDNLNDVQKKITTRDKAKHTYILNNHNIEILYLWENDIYNNLDMCNLLLHEYIRSDGKLNNYHSFN